MTTLADRLFGKAWPQGYRTGVKFVKPQEQKVYSAVFSTSLKSSNLHLT